MAEVIASKRHAKGVLLQKVCPGCRHAFWSNANDQRGQCVDCDPHYVQPNFGGFGRNHDRKTSDRQYHGSLVE